MTMNRDRSLARLLNSLMHAHYDANQVNLHIWIDVESDNATPDSLIMQTCSQVNWIHGNKEVHVHHKKAGLRGQWLDTWKMSVSDEELQKKKSIIVLLEDDVEVSPFFWRWLKLGHEAYAHRVDIAGFSLGRLNLTV